MAKKQKQIPFKSYPDLQKLTVIKVNDKGQGIASLDEYEIYLDDVIVGEEVLASIEPPFVNGSKRRPGIIKEYLKKSEKRCDNNAILDVPAVYALGNLKYEETLKVKAQDILNALRKAEVEYQKDLEVVPTDISKVSRFKSIRYFANSTDGLINGYYLPHSHNVQKVSSSPMEPQWFSDLANTLCAEFTKIGLTAFDEIEKTGTLKSLLLRDTLDGRLCVLVVSRALSDDEKSLYKKVCDNFKVDAIFINVNQTLGNQVIDFKKENMISLTDKTIIDFKLDDFTFKVGPTTFLQVNYEIAQKLYTEAVLHCAKASHGTALDLCCGVGTMSLCLSKYFSKVIGVEIVEDSIKAANDNALLNKVSNTTFICGDIKDTVAALVKDNDVDAIILDPSRVGAGDEVIKAISKCKQVKLSYIFCSLKALSRDVKSLIKQGFVLEEVKGFDMFPFSSHVETLCTFSKK